MSKAFRLGGFLPDNHMPMRVVVPLLEATYSHAAQLLHSEEQMMHEIPITEGVVKLRVMEIEVFEREC